MVWKPWIDYFNSRLILKENNFRMDTLIKSQFDEFTSVLSNTLNPSFLEKILHASVIMCECLKSGNKILSAGNGGSMSDAMHFSSELVGKYRGVRPAFAAVALSDQGNLSCISNDFGYSLVFKRQIEAIGRSGDVFLALSTSGKSENILIAAERARLMGMKVISISGRGGKISEYSDINIEIQHQGTADRVQEITILVIHILVMLIEKGML